MTEKQPLASLPAACQDKVVSLEEAVAKVHSGDRVFVGTACATPRSLIRALENMERRLSHVTLFHFLTDGAIFSDERGPSTRYKHKTFFVGTDTREIVKQGKAEYIPLSLAKLPELIRNDKISFDVAMVQASLPDAEGFVSLGVSVDITRVATEKAKMVIAELNPNMPRTHGDAMIRVEQIDYLVLVDTPVIEYTHEPADTVAEQIARYVARIIDDGSTLQIGLGRIPNEMLKYLVNRRDLGIHSDVITEPIIDLIEKGVITGKEKFLHHGEVVTSYCMGTRRLYDLVHVNPRFLFKDIDYVCDPSVIAQNNKMVSVTQAFAVDLTGQICADQLEGEFYSGVSTQPDFLRGAADSPGGKPIICLASTTDDGSETRIRPALKEGEGVTIPRAEVHYVITEYGYAYLFGKSIRERALALIEISHPEYRPWLLEEAKRLGYLRKNQILRSQRSYPEEEEREVNLRDGRKVLLRPSKATDEEGLQDLFYQLNPEDVYTRFFTNLTSLSVSKAQHLCNVGYENEMVGMAVIGEREQEVIVGSVCYFVDLKTNFADVGYMIRPEWQGCGLGLVLQEWIIRYARAKGLLGFTADVLHENKKMLTVFEKSGCLIQKNVTPSTIEVKIIF